MAAIYTTGIPFLHRKFKYEMVISGVASTVSSIFKKYGIMSFLNFNLKSKMATIQVHGKAYSSLCYLLMAGIVSLKDTDTIQS